MAIAEVGLKNGIHSHRDGGRPIRATAVTIARATEGGRIAKRMRGRRSNRMVAGSTSEEGFTVQACAIVARWDRCGWLPSAWRHVIVGHVSPRGYPFAMMMKDVC